MTETKFRSSLAIQSGYFTLKKNIPFFGAIVASVFILNILFSLLNELIIVALLNYLGESAQLWEFVLIKTCKIGIEIIVACFTILIALKVSLDGVDGRNLGYKLAFNKPSHLGKLLAMSSLYAIIHLSIVTLFLSYILFFIDSLYLSSIFLFPKTPFDLMILLKIAPFFFAFCSIIFITILGLIFSPLLIMDEGISILESFKRAKVLTKGKRIRIIAFVTYLLAINTLGLAFFFIGLLFSIPLTTLSLAAAYRQLNYPGDAAENA
jgi:hypothetical protein